MHLVFLFASMLHVEIVESIAQSMRSKHSGFFIIWGALWPTLWGEYINFNICFFPTPLAILRDPSMLKT